MIVVTAFAWVPPFAEGLVRDLRVRWALEEAGEPYEERLLEQGRQNSPGCRATDLITARPALHAYQLRSEARPAFQKALAHQVAPFESNAPPAVAA